MFQATYYSTTSAINLVDFDEYAKRYDHSLRRYHQNKCIQHTFAYLTAL